MGPDDGLCKEAEEGETGEAEDDGQHEAVHDDLVLRVHKRVDNPLRRAHLVRDLVHDR